MTEVSARELRNASAQLLARAEAGEQIVITNRGRPVAELVPARPARRRWLPHRELIERLAVIQADPGLRDDLRRLVGDTTDDLGDAA